MTNQVAVHPPHVKPGLGKPTQGRHPSPGLPTPRKETRRRSALQPDSPCGFTMVELLVALGLGLLVAAWIIEALLAHSSFSAKLADRLHHREFERRARRLIEDDRRLASRATSQPGAQAPACNLAGRQPLLHLELPNGKPAITWSLGAAPSAIWRGQVLMRCGPAYGLDGQPNLQGSWQNRVVLDRAEGFAIPI